MWFLHHAQTGAVSFDFERNFQYLPLEDTDALNLLMSPLPEPNAPPPSPVLSTTTTRLSTTRCTECTPAVVCVAQPTRCATPDHLTVKHTAETDACILASYARLGQKWRAISESLGGRSAGFSDDVVRNRHHRLTKIQQNGKLASRASKHARPSAHHRRARGAWTKHDDELLLKLVDDAGRRPSWHKIASEFGGARTVHAVRNRLVRATGGV